MINKEVNNLANGTQREPTERERHHEERAENKVRERMDETQEKREKRYLVASFEFV